MTSTSDTKRWRGWLVAATLLTGAHAQAQTTTTTSPLMLRLSVAPSADLYAFSTGLCGTTQVVQWRYDGTLGSLFSTPLSLWATTASACTTAPAAGDVVYTSVAATTVALTKSGNFNVAINSLPGFSDADGGVTCGQLGVTVTHQICGAISYSAYIGATASVYQADGLTLVYDTKPPGPPTIAGTESLDSAASVNFTFDGDTDHITSQYRNADGGTWLDGPATTNSTATSVTIRNLQNNWTYAVQIRAFDLAGNGSDQSAEAIVTPKHTVGFLELARRQGSDETGGCSSVGGTSLAAFGVVAAFLLRRRPKRGVLLLGLVVAAKASAQAFPAEGDQRMASPRRILLEFKGSPFTPRIDNGFAAGAGPYQTVYDGKPMLLGEIELDVEVFQRWGTLSVGVSGGYSEIYGHALVATTDGSQVRSAEASGLHIVPLKLLLAYRFDMLWPKFRVPLAPYVKAGPVLMPWWVTKGDSVEVVDNFRGAGYKLGIAATVGIALIIDFLDPRLALDFDAFSGVNHTAIFAEYTFQEMNLFEFAKDSHPLNLSSWFWSFGIHFEF